MAFRAGLKELGWSVTGNVASEVKIDGNIQAVLKTCAYVKANPLGSEKSLFKITDGPVHVAQSDPHRDEFCGGSTRDLEKRFAGDINMKPFLKAKDKLLSTGVLERAIPESVLAARRRKRINSEHDGDWDMNRRWDPAPFSAARRELQLVKRIELDCHLSVNCSVDAENYNRFGSLAWAICELLESAGIQTKINALYRTSSVDGEQAGLTGNIRVVVKEFGEYVAPSLVATVFTTVFYRRAMFMMYCAIPESMTLQVSSGLGRSEAANQPIAYKDGKIIISPNVDFDCVSQIEEVLFKSMHGQEEKPAEEKKGPPLPQGIDMSRFFRDDLLKKYIPAGDFF